MASLESESEQLGLTHSHSVYSSRSAGSIATGGVHHCTLVVSDIRRSVAFYTKFLGFRYAMDIGERILLGNGSIILALTTPPTDLPHPDSQAQSTNMDQGRVGVDHLSFTVATLAELESARAILAAQQIEHSEIQDLGPDLGIYVLSFFDPDNIQLELRAPYAPVDGSA